MRTTPEQRARWAAEPAMKQPWVTVSTADLLALIRDCDELEAQHVRDQLTIGLVRGWGDRLKTAINRMIALHVHEEGWVSECRRIGEEAIGGR